MKNLKTLFVLAIVAFTFTTRASAQYRYHSMVKPKLEGLFTGERFKIRMANLYRFPSADTAHSIFQFGDDFARQVYDDLLNKYFAKKYAQNGLYLTNDEKVGIIMGSSEERIPEDYATCSEPYAGSIQRYSKDDTGVMHVSTWTRPANGDTYMVFDGKPYVVKRCGNGYELINPNAIDYKWAPAPKPNPAPQPVEKPCCVIDHRFDVPAIASDCNITNYIASKYKLKKNHNQSSVLSYATDGCSYVQINGGKKLAPNGTLTVSPNETTAYILVTENGQQRVITIKVKTWTGRNLAWIIPTGVVIVAVLIIWHPWKSPQKTYPNDIQGTSGEAGTSGGTGGQYGAFTPPRIQPLTASMMNIPSNHPIMNGATLNSFGAPVTPFTATYIIRFGGTH